MYTKQAEKRGLNYRITNSEQSLPLRVAGEDMWGSKKNSVTNRGADVTGHLPLDFDAAA